jgi:hypothetical protein
MTGKKEYKRKTRTKTVNINKLIQKRQRLGQNLFRRIMGFLNISTFLHTLLVAATHLAEGKFLQVLVN